MKLDLGGGSKPRPGYVNVDVITVPGVDHMVDFETLYPDGTSRLPFQDDSVEEVYCSHCVEHCNPYRGLLWEVVRVCRLGALVEIRVPHWLHPMAMCAGHKHVISLVQVRHWVKDYITDWWEGSKKRLQLDETEYVRGEDFNEAKVLHPGWSDDQLMRFIPGACHEVRFRLTVVLNEVMP